MTPDACSSDDVSLQVSAPYNKTVNMNDLYKQIFVLEERALSAYLLNKHLLLKFERNVSKKQTIMWLIVKKKLSKKYSKERWTKNAFSSKC